MKTKRILCTHHWGPVMVRWLYRYLELNRYDVYRKCSYCNSRWEAWENEPVITIKVVEE